MANLRTQLAPGYTYPENVRTFSSAFLSPAYLLTSIGIDFKPTEGLSLFLSPITIRLLIVKDDSLSARGLYRVDTGRHFNSELGAFGTINYIKDWSKNVLYRGRLDLFSNYNHNPQNVDLLMTNVISLKLARFLTANWNLDFIYDDDVLILERKESHLHYR